MKLMCEGLDHYMFARISTTRKGQTDIITTAYLFCMQDIFFYDHFWDTYGGKLAWSQKFVFYCKEYI